jgi:hypothetical protein
MVALIMSCSRWVVVDPSSFFKIDKCSQAVCEKAQLPLLAIACRDIIYENSTMSLSFSHPCVMCYQVLPMILLLLSSWGSLVSVGPCMFIRVLHWAWQLYPYPTHSNAWVNCTHPLPTHGTLSIPTTHPTHTHQSITKIKLLKSTLKCF